MIVDIKNIKEFNTLLHGAHPFDKSFGYYRPIIFYLIVDIAD